MNLPVIENTEDLKQVNVAFIGVPWEGGCTIGGFSSCTLSPKSIRSASIRYTGFLPEFDMDCYDYLKAGDYGDTALKNGDYDFTFGEIGKKIGEIVDAGAMPFTFGGDHGITLPIVTELAKRHPKRVGVIHFDAHLDNYDGYGDDVTLDVLLSSICTRILTWPPQRSFTWVSVVLVTTEKNCRTQKILVRQ